MNLKKSHNNSSTNSLRYGAESIVEALDLIRKVFKFNIVLWLK